MSETGKNFFRGLSPYLVTIFLLLSAVPLGLALGPIFLGAALLLAALSFLITRRLVSQLQSARQRTRLLDEQILQSQKLAALGELSAGVAHEINNPLAIIRQEAEWVLHILKHQETLPSGEREELQGSVAEIIQQVDRCREITHNLLDFARRREPVLQAVDLNKLIEAMTLLVEREAKHNNITIVRQFGNNLPAVSSDAPQLRQVILNLLNNATHAVQKDGVITITTRLAGNNSIDLLVSDTGGGIPPDYLRKIFDPFFTTKAPGKGTGLGLSISHGIIQRLGGRISVDSVLGRGTTFTVNLPLKPEKGRENAGKTQDLGSR